MNARFAQIASAGVFMTRLRSCVPVLAVAVVIGSTVVVRTQSPRPMGIVDLLNVPQLRDPQLAPDGRDILYTCTDADWKQGKRISHIWRVAISGGQPVQLTNGSDGESTPRWSPVGKTVAFTAKRGDNEFAQIYVLPVDGGEARPLTTHASAVSDISW